MQNLFLGITLGNDPHTMGIFNAGKIARMLEIKFEVVPVNATDIEKIKIISELNPAYIGLSYRLSTDKAFSELKKFLDKMEEYNLLQREEGRKICFSALQPAIEEIYESEICRNYDLHLMMNYSDLSRRTRQTANFFGVTNTSVMNEIIERLNRENDTSQIKILDEIASNVVESYDFLPEQKLKKPSDAALNSFTQRMKESKIPLIRSHFGVPADTIFPTVGGIKKIASSGSIDELSLGSSDLSQRYYGEPEKFKELKNDGGVPYKDIKDLKILADAAKTGNFPAMKPYCHVKNIIPFIDDCLQVGMLKGAHQAIPLFWFGKLDGRGDMTLEEAVYNHIAAVKHLVKKNIPVEMNDPNQWSLRYVHDSLLVVSYSMILSVMYSVGAKEIILQCHFNDPATTGDYADLGKFFAVKKMTEALRPVGNKSQIYFETRSGIGHFNSDLRKAKFQLARSILLQMLINPSVLHMVSYCEADHVATADDIIDSSKILRRAVRLFNENVFDIKKQTDFDIVNARAEYLFSEAMTVLETLTKNSPQHLMYQTLSKPDLLISAVKNRYLTAPGITCAKYSNPDITTKATQYGFLDCYKNWEAPIPLTERERLAGLPKI